jgi:acetyl-CoA carboxylase biotin carboxylase subunit
MSVPIHYDPMISKLVVWGPDRASALARARRALLEYHIVGTATSIPFFLALFEDASFNQGIYDTSFIQPEWLETALGDDEGPPRATFIAAAVLAFERDATQPHEVPSQDVISAWRGLGSWNRGGGQR